MNPAGELRQIAIDQLECNRFQPRQKFDMDKLTELAQAIKTTHGLLQPIVVRPLPNEKYEIIAGERRWRAAKLARFDSVSCLVRDCDDQKAFEASLIENVSRTDLNPIEEANAYQRLIDEFVYSHEEIAMMIGKSRTKITNALRLLKLDLRVQQFLIEGSLTEGHGKVLVGFPPQLQYPLAHSAVKNNWSVRETEQEAKREIRLTNEPPKDINIQALERALSDHIGCQVKIDYKDTQGKLMINFYNLDVLEGLLAKLGFIS